jgi:hypothetical protein
MIIQNGAQGSTYGARVTSDHRLETDTIAKPRVSFISEKGGAFAYSTGFISLTTTASYNGILSIKGVANFTKLNQLRFCSTVTTQWLIYKNSTTGTLYSGGTSDTAKNINFGSGTPFSGIILKGANALTVTDGELIGCLVTGNYAGAQLAMEDFLILRPNNTVSMVAKPTGTGEVSVTCIMYEEDTI